MADEPAGRQPRTKPNFGLFNGFRRPLRLPRKLWAQVELRHRRASTRPSPSLALVETNRLLELRRLLELAAHTTHPLAVLVSAEPVLGRATKHRPSDLASPAVALLFALHEGVLGKVGCGGLHVGGIVPRCGRGVCGDVFAQALAGKSQHDEDEVDAESPEAGNKSDAHDAAALEDNVSETGAGTVADCNRILAGLHALAGRSNNVDLGNIVLGACEAGVIGDTLRSGDV